MLEVIAAATVLVIVIGTVYRVYRITPKEIATLAEDGWEVVNEGTYSRLYWHHVDMGDFKSETAAWRFARFNS